MRERIDLMKYIHPWLKASRLTAQGFIIPPLLLGHAIAIYLGYQVTLETVILIHTYGLFMHLFIVYINDYADYETDQLNQTYTPFTGGSRVLVEGMLSKVSLKKAARFMALLTIINGIILSIASGTLFITLLILLGIFLMIAYSLQPIAISYRGYGETLQVIGVAIILPLVAFLSHGGTMGAVLWAPILALLPAQFAMAVSTSLPDEPSDKTSGKHTTVVNLGGQKARVLMILLFLLSYFVSVVIIQNNGAALWPVLLAAFPFALLVSIALKYNAIPGSRLLSGVVLLAILTNTTLVLSVSVIYMTT